MEEQLIKNIENAFRAIQSGSKTLKDANVNMFLKRLKTINLGMAEDLQKKYVNIVRNLKK